MFKNPCRFYWCILACIASMFPACSCNQASQQKKSDSTSVLVLATNSEPDTLNPIFAEMASSWEILALGHRELVMQDDHWNLFADLATEVPTIKNKAVRMLPGGQMAVTWHIKANAKWEDGVDVTGQDVLLAWKICLDKTQEIIDRDTCQRIKNIDVDPQNPKTFTVTWKEPFAFFNAYRVHPLVPSHILTKRYYAADGSTKDLKKDPYGNKPLSNGPFKFKEWVPGQHIVYTRNENYEPKAKLEEIVIRIIPNVQSIESNINAGSVDAVLPSGGLTIPQLEQLKRGGNQDLTFYSVPGMVWAHIDFNLDNPVLQNPKVRLALAHAMNRTQIIEHIYANQYQVANSFLPPLHWGYDSHIPNIPFDLKKAATLLDKAGYKETSAGQTRVDQAGNPLVIQLSAVSGARDIEQMEQVFQSDLRKIGVELQIDNKPAKVFFGKYGRYRKFAALSFYSWGMDSSSFGLTLWHRNFIPSDQNNWQGQNYPGWRNEEVSTLLDKVSSILNENERKAILQKVQAIWYRELPTIPMYFRPVVTVSKKQLVHFRPTGGTSPISWNAHEWEITT